MERPGACLIVLYCFGKALLGFGLHLRFKGKSMDGMKAFALIKIYGDTTALCSNIGSYPAELLEEVNG